MATHSFFFKEQTKPLYPKHLNDIFILSILKQVHTKILLKLLQCFRNINWDYLSCDEHNVLHYWQGDYKNAKYYITPEQLRDELATRPHIPNKKESKALRIARKKSGIKRNVRNSKTNN